MKRGSFSPIVCIRKDGSACDRFRRARSARHCSGFWMMFLAVFFLGNGKLSVKASELRECTISENGAAQDCNVGGNDASLSTTVLNHSRHRVDIYQENGRFGKFVSILERQNPNHPEKVSSVALTEPGEYFFTIHGTKQNLFVGNGSDKKEETPLRFQLNKSEPQSDFIIPSYADPSSNPCQDRFDICVKEAKRGECLVNPGWMIVHCCRSCDEYSELDAQRLIDPKERCSREFLNITEPAWKAPGDLDDLFRTWATDPSFQDYEPRVLASPHEEFNGNESLPWVMVFDKFLSDEEADALIEGGRLMGFQRSTDQGPINNLGEQQRVVSQSRTSSNAWCVQDCAKMPLVQEVTARIESFTGIPRSHYEQFQILEYQVGQFYRTHHDSTTPAKKIADPRILTFFLYLSDVEEGGETGFPRLLDGLAVPPKKGRALIWPSILNEDPSTMDRRMYHEARPVVKGVKYAANHWIHLYSYEDANKWGCTGSFS